jgi:uncharacterized protein
MTRKPPSETSTPDASSRRARLLARRHRRTRIGIAVAIVVVLGAVAAGAYALSGQDPKANAVGAPGAKAARIGGSTTTPAPNAVKTLVLRKLDHGHPLKLWVGGDSLAGSFGPALGDQVGATGVVETRVDYRVSSGLWSNDLRNWDERATEQMTSENPDAVVFIIGTNDTPIVNKVDANGDGIPDWEVEYRLKVAKMMDILVGTGHRTVFWLGPPTLGTRSMDAGAKEMGEVMRQEAVKRAADVEYLDTYKLFSTSDGTYSRHILDENGNEITARIGDGVHFSEAGAEYLARAVFKLIDARWHMTNQADLKDPIGWTLAPGSGESVPGYSSRPRSRYRSGNSGGSNNNSSPTTSGQSSDSTVPSDPTTVSDTPTTAAQSTTPPTNATPTTQAPTVTVPHTPTTAGA